MNFQEKREQCKDINIVIAPKEKVNISQLNTNTSRLIDMYYVGRRKFLDSYFIVLEQLKFKTSNQRYDRIQYNRSTLDSNLSTYAELKWVLGCLEKSLNIKPDKSVDNYKLEVNIEDA